jgi:hypothetical protein
MQMQIHSKAREQIYQGQEYAASFHKDETE